MDTFAFGKEASARKGEFRAETPRENFTKPASLWTSTNQEGINRGGRFGGEM